MATRPLLHKKQLGRRNLTIEQRSYLLGKMYEARKNVSAFKGNQHIKAGDAQTGQKQTTAEKIAKEQGVGANTVRRAGDFAKGVDAIRKISPEAADKILQWAINNSTKIQLRYKNI